MRATILAFALFAAVQAFAQTSSSGSSTQTSSSSTTIAISPGTVTSPVPPPTTPAVYLTPGAGSSGTTTPASTVTLPAGETSLSLDIGYGIRFVPASRVTVPLNEQVRITAPSNGGPLQWQKDGKVIVGATTNPLVLPNVTSADAGTYLALYTDPAMAWRGTQALVLAVGPTTRLINISTRGWVGGADQPFIAGFVVTTENASAAKKAIVRAIGPSLAKFGVSNYLRKPAIKIYDSAGREYTNSYAYPAVVGGPTYESDLADSLVRCGAFATDVGSGDVTQLRPFAGGSYTIHVTSVDGSAGAVLVEVYEVP